MSDTNFQPIFDYIDKSKEDLKVELLEVIATKEQIKNLQDSVDAFARESKNHKQEDVIHKAQTSRIEKWVITAAEKIEVPYEP